MAAPFVLRVEALTEVNAVEAVMQRNRKTRRSCMMWSTKFGFLPRFMHLVVPYRTTATRHSLFADCSTSALTHHIWIYLLLIILSLPRYILLHTTYQVLIDRVVYLFYNKKY